MLNLLSHLGFITNKTKSQLIPGQKIVYLSSLFRLDQGLVFPTLEIIQNIELAVQTLILAGNQMSSAQTFLRVLGLIAPCLELIPYARLFMKPIQLHITFLETFVQRFRIFDFHYSSSRTFEVAVNESEHFKGQIPLNMGSDNHSYNRCFEHWVRGVHREKFLSGEVVKNETSLHINHMELEAVYKSIVYFLPHLKN